jgi:hypothetical protein
MIILVLCYSIIYIELHEIVRNAATNEMFCTYSTLSSLKILPASSSSSNKTFSQVLDRLDFKVQHSLGNCVPTVMFVTLNNSYR